MTGHPSVVVVGAGIVGASLAYHLASAGAAVTLVERSRPASGVTARSFAWINVIYGNAPTLVGLRNLALADHHRLERGLKRCTRGRLEAVRFRGRRIRRIRSAWSPSTCAGATR